MEIRKGIKQKEETVISNTMKLGENSWILLNQDIYAFTAEIAEKKHAPCSIPGGPMIPSTAYFALRKFKRRTAGNQSMPVRNGL